MRPEKSEVERLWASNRKAMDMLGWKPAYDLDTGLRETIDWFGRHDNMKHYNAGSYTI
jgi:dTDP-glucose 4,6-dehydratase